MTEPYHLLSPLRDAWRRNGARFVGNHELTDAELVAWAARCVNALIDIDTMEGAPTTDRDERDMWIQVVSGGPLGSVG